MTRLLVLSMLLASAMPGGCAAPGPVSPVIVSESMRRAIWKSKNCGLGVSFAACQKAWEAAK